MDLIDKFNKELNAAYTEAGVLGQSANKAKKPIEAKIQEFSEDNDMDQRKNPEDYLINSDNMKKIYLLAKNRKLSANKIKEKIKDYLKEPNELKSFLNSILDSKGKKSENKEAMSTGGMSGTFEPVLSLGNTKKVETKEATGAGAGVGAYETPKAWAKSMNKKDWRGKSKTQIPGGKFVQVKKKCKRFPYCNQGDIKALNFFNEQTTEKVINSMSKKYGLTENEIKEIIFREFKLNQKY
jgi:hypothetical protein